MVKHPYNPSSRKKEINGHSRPVRGPVSRKPGGQSEEEQFLRLTSDLHLPGQACPSAYTTHARTHTRACVWLLCFSINYGLHSKAVVPLTKPNETLFLLRISPIPTNQCMLLSLAQMLFLPHHQPWPEGKVKSPQWLLKQDGRDPIRTLPQWELLALQRGICPRSLWTPGITL